MLETQFPIFYNLILSESRVSFLYENCIEHIEQGIIFLQSFNDEFFYSDSVNKSVSILNINNILAVYPDVFTLQTIKGLVLLKMRKGEEASKCFDEIK